MSAIASICEELRSEQRILTTTTRLRIMANNAIRGIVAGPFIGDKPSEGEWAKAYKEADKLIAAVLDEGKPHPFAGQIIASFASIGEFCKIESEREKKIIALAKRLPVAPWVEGVRGFGLKSLGAIVGEAGDLSGYATHCRLWRRFGLAPWEYQGQVKMGCTWRKRSHEKLPAEEWTKYKYSPRRRSVIFVIGESLLKGNRGIYRQHYDESKTKTRKMHPEWWLCEDCGGDKAKRGKCKGCGGKGERPGHAHNHAMLLMTKLLLRDLWKEWHRRARSKRAA